MVKFFGLMFALAAMVSSANAALLVSYNFNDPDSTKDPSVVTSGISAETSVGNWNSSASTFNLTQSVSSTGTTRSESFKFNVVSPNSVTLDTFTFDAGVAGPRTVGFTPTFKLNNVLVSSSLYTVSQASGSGAYTVTFNPQFAIGAGSTFEGLISARATTGGTSGNLTSLSLDNVNFNGALVPEPASMAVFGLLGAGFAIRRLRRNA
ncbi:MAG: PEP-CTERM sorting domain-containing protein [Planctomycetota bacterium]|nr:PEP-CTERM sorting domain-containing protein [Planctomycetota bacterium]